MNWKQIDFNWNPFLSIGFFGVQKENQLKVDWCQLKSLLKLTILKIVEGIGGQKMPSYWVAECDLPVQYDDMAGGNM